ncbi:hypothetical protein [Ekhidna sp.]
MKKNFITLLFLVSAFFLISCSSGSSSSGESTAEKKEEIEDFVEKEFTYPLPTAFEVSQMLGNANTSYSENIVNDPTKVDQYVATWQKAVNLGVYGADLSYAATFDKTQETIDYLDVSKKLIDDLNITSAFNSSMAQRIENNMDNIDSLIFIVTESFYDTYNYLNQNGEEKTSILVVAGSVVEGLHITCELVKMSENRGELMAVLANQKSQVTKLLELMDNFQDDENVKRMLPSLRFISLTYDQLGEGVEMTSGQFDDISNNVKIIRDEIVG